MLQTRSSRLQDFERWRAAGWLTPEGAAGIRGEIEAASSGVGLAHVLATLAAVLIGFAAMSFVAANWQEMSKLLRLAIIIGGLWGLLGLAGWLKVAGHPYFADAAALAAVALYGAGIMLIAQMYHMDGHPPDAVLLWGAGTVAAGLMMRSNPVLAAALVLFCVWSGMETSEWERGVHWGFLPAWASVAAGIAWTRWRPGMHLLSIALSGWIVLQPYIASGPRDFAGHVIVTLIGLALMAASILAGPAIDRWRRISGNLLNYGFLIAYAGLFAIQFVIPNSGIPTLLLGVVTIAGILGVLAWAWRTQNRTALWIAYAVFSIEIFSLYIKKIGTLLGTSLFFLVMGLIVAALAAVAFRLHSGTRPRLEAQP